jgi:hypothetical protein
MHEIEQIEDTPSLSFQVPGPQREGVRLNFQVQTTRIAVEVGHVVTLDILLYTTTHDRS